MTLLAEAPADYRPPCEEVDECGAPEPETVGGASLVAIAFLGLVLAAGTAFFAFVVPAIPGRMAKNSGPLTYRLTVWRSILEHAPVPHSPAVLGASVVLVSTVMFLAYAATIRLVWRRRGRGALVAVALIATVCGALTVFALPTHTSDVYDYALFGRVASQHGGEPYVDLPDQFRDDPIYPFSSHQYTGKPDNKLPVWTSFSIAISKVAGDDPLINLFLYRMVLALLAIGCGGLVLFILARIHPAAALSGVTVLALNPVMIVYGSSKTDTLMVFLLLAGLAAVATGRSRLATVLLTLSPLVKLITLPVLAVYLVHRIGRARWGALTDLLLVAVTIAFVYAPYPKAIDLAADHLGFLGDGGSSLPDPLQPIGTTVFGVVVAVAVLRRAPAGMATGSSGAATELVWRWVPVTLFFAIFLTRLGLPWYVLTAVAIAAIAGRGLVTAILVTLSWSSFLFGAWYSASTRLVPLPDVFAFGRSLVYVAPTVAVAILVGAHNYRARSRHGEHPIEPARRGEVNA